MSDKPPVYEAQVRGAIFHGEAAMISHGLTLLGEGLLLEREPLNPADSNAILVKRDNGQSVGYIAAEIAARMSPWMDQGWLFNCLCIKQGIVRLHRGRYYIKPQMIVRCIPIQQIKLGIKLRKRVEELA